MPLVTRRLLTAAVAQLALAPSVAWASRTEDAFHPFVRGSSATVNHEEWSSLLGTYVVANKSGPNGVRYARWKAEAHAKLKSYIGSLQKVSVANLDRPEQFAFWANLYNAKTIDIVLDHYPIGSIKSINLGGGLIASLKGGPWSAKVVDVAGVDLSLDDIEHVILRGIFRDARVHYAVNCASIGCPSLRPKAFAGAALAQDLDAAAREFVNSRRAFSLRGSDLRASSIYSWFQADFGSTEAGVLAHARRYAAPATASLLDGSKPIAEYTYDWTLNDDNG